MQGFGLRGQRVFVGIWGLEGFKGLRALGVGISDHRSPVVGFFGLGSDFRVLGSAVGVSFRAFEGGRFLIFIRNTTPGNLCVSGLLRLGSSVPGHASRTIVLVSGLGFRVSGGSSCVSSWSFFRACLSASATS